jgi:EpsI family protein
MNSPLKNLLIGFLLFAAAGAALALKPTHKIADLGPKVVLETLIPRQFADWQIDDKVVPLQADPQQKALLSKIYNQTLLRTYVNPKGERIMLSIAYGGDQSDNMGVHKPEICYPAQGLPILNLVAGVFNTGFSEIPVKRLVASRGNGAEPITYWITVGDTVAISGLKWKLAQLKYGLTGRVPDGLLFRVSSIGRTGEEEIAYRLQEEFIRDLLKPLSPESRKRLIGSATL